MNFSEPVEAVAMSLPCNLMHLSDQNLLGLAKAGDPAAFVELGERHSMKIRRTVYRIHEKLGGCGRCFPGISGKGFKTSEWLREQIQLLLVAYQDSNQFRSDDFEKEESIQRSLDRHRGRLQKFRKV